MFKFKLWVTVLLYLVAGAVLVLLGTPKLHDAIMPPLERRADAAARAVGGELLVDAEAVVSAAAALTAAPGARELVDGKAPNASDELLAALVPDVGGRIKKASFGLIVDAKGAVIALAGEDPGFEPNIMGVPAVADSLRGVMRDALTVMNKSLFHVGVAPIYSNGKPAGAVLLGWKIDAGYVDSLGADVGEDVVLVAAKERVGGALPDLAVDALLDVAGGTPFGEFKHELGVPLPLLVADVHRYVGSSRAAFRGQGDARFVIAVDRSDALNAIATLQLLVLGATLIAGLVIFILVFSVLRSISRPLSQIMDHLSQHAQGNAVGILPESALSGPFVRLGKQINMILQAPAPVAGQQRGGGSSPLSPPSIPKDAFDSTLPDLQRPPPPPFTDPGSKPVSFDGIPGLSDDDDDKPPQTPPTSRQAPVSNALANSALSGLFDEGSADPLAAFRVPGKGAGTNGATAPPPPPPGAASLPGMGAAPPPPPPSEGPPDDFSPEATAMFQVPESLLLESAQSGTGAAVGRSAGPAAAEQQDEGARTVIAQIPTELLNKSAGTGGITPAEETHFKEVFGEFVRVREQCGEETDQLTYDRFLTKLMKNRQQIIEKYNSKSVRFQVYVKQGKAALRAVPVRD